MSIIVIKPIDPRLPASARLDGVLNFALENIGHETINTAEQLKHFSGKKLLYIGCTNIYIMHIKSS